MKTLYLIRGPSGSGKSTIARSISRAEATPEQIHCDPLIFETDMFFGEDYAFDPQLLSDAHAWCRLSVMREMVSEEPCIIVSNTFIKLWEMGKYLNLAERFGYVVEIIKTPGPWDADELFKRREHSGRTTPMNVIQRHIDNYEPYVNTETDWTDLSIFE